MPSPSTWKNFDNSINNSFLDLFKSNAPAPPKLSNELQCFADWRPVRDCAAHLSPLVRRHRQRAYRLVDAGAAGRQVDGAIVMTFMTATNQFSATETYGSELDGAQRADLFDAVRLGEVALAGLILAFMSPFLAVVALLIWVEDGGPVFFSQMRVGRGGKRFPCMKLRTMSIDAPARLARLLETREDAREEWARDHKLKNDPRITWLGRFLRKASIDEFPQLINVIRGDMSLVGPRPIVDAEVVRYGRRFEAYCTVRPGITGLWQVKGRNDVSYRRRVAIDTIYCANKSFGLDMRIVAATVPVVLFRRGSY